MARKAAFIVLLFCALRSHAQIPDITVVNATNAANRLVGDNVVVTNATFSGDASQLARFTDGTSKVGIAQGVVLTTGQAVFAGEWNDGTVFGSCCQLQTSNSDQDLDLINGPGTSKDAAVLEFDFVTTSNSITFDYVFASKEYLEYVGSNFNDAFGFFVSGPGISGPFTNNAVNIALIGPDPVSVNTINDIINPAFYINNNLPDPFYGVQTSEANAFFAYDGKTVVMSATLEIECNTTYHAKLAICNTGDHLFHSGVFIKSGTLTSPYSPPGPLTVAPSPQCEGQPLTLNVVGDPSWTYTWSTGQTGVGLQQITTPAVLGVNSYSVTAEYLPGCTLTGSSLAGDVVVHSSNNTPPSCLGINGTGNYQAYVQAGDQLCFQIPTSDTPTEGVLVDWNGGAPGSFSNNGQFQQTALYCWTPAIGDIGTYSFTMTATDLNVCDDEDTQCFFSIKVVCDFCPISVFYENRSPGGLPLPVLTEAGWRIVAGESVDPSQTDGPVLTGSATVEFRAPEILLEPGFVGGPSFLAIPDPNTCLDACDDCCDNWTGFTVDTYDPDGDGNYSLNDWFEPDGDGVFDFWQVNDRDHPFCAYGAQAYELTIIPAASSWGNPVYYIYDSPGVCCPFESRTPENPIAHSGIFWDGTINAGIWNCQGCTVTTGAYYAYILHLYGCEGELTFTGLIYAAGSSGLAPEPAFVSVDPLAANQDLRSSQAFASDTSPEPGAMLQLFPNPGSDLVTVASSDAEILAVYVEDIVGQQVAVYPGVGGRTFEFSVAHWAKGEYIFTIRRASGRLDRLRFVKT